MNQLRKEISEMLQIDARDGGFTATLNVDAALSVLPDHFRDQPILPGICLVQAVLLAAAQRQGVEELRIRTLKNMKLMQPIRPGDRVNIDADITDAPDGALAIKTRLTMADRKCAEISLIAGPAETGKAAQSQ
jgi:3-hydroxymyristoyl/3-hydroxydecanoyl-(acyl carrier protein) dehydratase